MENRQSTFMRPDELQLDTRLFFVAFIVIGLFLLTATAFVSYQLGRQSVSQKPLPPTDVVPTASPSEANTVTVCTMDAKLCPDGSSVGRTGPNCEFAACPVSQNTLPYSYITHVRIDKEWHERGIPLRQNSIREYESNDGCVDLYIADQGSLETDLEQFASKLYQTDFPINPDALYKTQYKIGTYKSITIGAMGAGEISNTLIENQGRAISVNVTATGKQYCDLPELSTKNLIESIRF